MRPRASSTPALLVLGTAAALVAVAAALEGSTRLVLLGVATLLLVLFPVLAWTLGRVLATNRRRRGAGRGVHSQGEARPRGGAPPR